MMKAFDQIISSTGGSLTGTPSISASMAWMNQASSTSATPLPELKIRSMRSPLSRTLASQCGYVSSVVCPARCSTSEMPG